MEKSTTWLPSRRYGNKINLLLFLFTCGLMAINIQSQGQSQRLKNLETVDESESTDMPELDEATIKAFDQRAQEKIQELQNYIIQIGNKNESDDLRNFAIETAAKMFIPDAIMQVSNVRTKRITEYNPIKKYFLRLKALPFMRVEIKFYQTAYLSNLRKGADGRYYATATVYQEFRGYHADGGSYSDQTAKTIDIVLDYIEDKYYNEKRWVMLFGDVKVAETRNI